MPKKLRMPKLTELPLQTADDGHASRGARMGWFMRGFAAAAILFVAALFFGGYFGSAVANHDGAPRKIIVGK
jgi:hypothetical protein